ncbi:MAG: hypothetical protein ABEJ23_08600 [Haloarculaceae archaeon]
MPDLPFALDGTALLVLGTIVGFVLVAQVLLSTPVLRYAAALLGFALWMAWFVLATVRWFDAART